MLSGIGLVALGLRLARAGYRVYGQILSGVGLAALFLFVYAAFDFYDLIGRTLAFALLLTVTVAPSRGSLTASNHRAWRSWPWAVGS